MFKHPADNARGAVFQGQQQQGEGGAKGKADKKAGAPEAADARARLMRQQGKVEHCQARVSVAHPASTVQHPRVGQALPDAYACVYSVLLWCT